MVLFGVLFQEIEALGMHWGMHWGIPEDLGQDIVGVNKRRVGAHTCQDPPGRHFTWWPHLIPKPHPWAVDTILFYKRGKWKLREGNGQGHSASR